MSKNKTKFKTKLKLFAVLLAVCLTIISCYKIDGTLGNTYFGKTPETIATNIDTLTDKTSFNTLLVGKDKSGVLTDAIMLVNINKANKTIHLLSIPRDTKVTVDGRKRKINSCYAKGGIDLLLDEVKQLTQVPVNYYAVINPGTLAQIVDALGGVEYEVERDMKYTDTSQDLYIDLKAGKQVLTGDMAEQYCRFRSYPLGDLQRTQAQRNFFKALFEQKLKLKYVTKLKSLYDVVSQNLETNITLKTVAENITILHTLSDGATIESLQVPGEYNDMKKEGVSYYLIYNEHLNKLRNLCSEYFSVK